MVTIIVPVFNEEKYIFDCIRSMLLQDYPLEEMEWIFVDGNSNDATRTIIEKFRMEYPNLIFIFDNPNKTQSNAMNIGILGSKGEYIIRLDAHATYPTNYIRKCMFYLEKGYADNVGGVIRTKTRTKKSEYLAKILSCEFGVGNSNFRTNHPGYVDTVPFGSFKKETLIKIGLYDTRLDRNEDNELNYRIRKNGGTVFLADDIHSTYYCRDKLVNLLSMARSNGKWNVIAFKLCPRSMSFRHFVPLLSILTAISLFALGFAIHWVWFIEIGLFLVYFVLDLVFSTKISSTIKEFLKIFFCFPLFHFNYGIGSVAGIFASFKFKRGKK